MEVTYEEFIQNILETRGRFNCGDEYCERHHIIPKCMGGTDEQDNLVDLFAKEHFEVHRLLALENPENDKLTYAWWCMCHVISETTKERYIITAEEYEEAKITFSNARKELLKNPENHPMYGRRQSEESKKKNREAHKGKRHTEETKRNIREIQKERWTDELREQWSKIQADNWTEDRKQKQSERMSGEGNPMFGVHRYGQDHPMFGKHMTEESKRKSSESHIGLYAGSKHPGAKQVIRLFDSKIYDCGKDAAIDNNINYSTFKNKCQNYKDFMYYDEWLAQQNDLKNNND